MTLAAMALLLATVGATAATGTASSGTDAPATARFLERPKRYSTAQIGMSLAAETVLSPGSMCPSGAAIPCILGSGGGIAVRLGYRLGPAWYFGGAYEFTHHDSSNLLRLAILQQLRAETRYYFERGNRATGYLAAGVGVHLYGSEWVATTGGPAANIGAGIEFELSANTVVGCAVMYRMLFPHSYEDSAGQQRAEGPLGFGLVQVLGLEFALEVRDPVPRW